MRGEIISCGMIQTQTFLRGLNACKQTLQRLDEYSSDPLECNAVPSKQDLVYVRVAENASLHTGSLICMVSVETAPGQLAVLPSNQIYSFGEGGSVDQNRGFTELPRDISEDLRGPYGGKEASTRVKVSSPGSLHFIL